MLTLAICLAPLGSVSTAAQGTTALSAVAPTPSPSPSYAARFDPAPGGGFDLRPVGGSASPRGAWSVGGVMAEGEAYDVAWRLQTLGASRIILRLAADADATSGARQTVLDWPADGALQGEARIVVGAGQRHLTVIALTGPGAAARIAELTVRPAAATAAATVPAQRGVTFHFAGAPVWGRYPNGDLWVVDDGDGVEIERIAPDATASAGRFANGAPWGGAEGARVWLNGAELNPGRDDQTAAEGMGLDGRAPGASYIGYADEKNVDPGRRGTLRVAAGDVVAKGVSFLGAETGRYLIEDYVLLTVVDAPPPAGAFRPGPADPDRRHRWTLDDLDFSILRDLPSPPSRKAMALLRNQLAGAYPLNIVSGNVSEPMRPLATWGRQLGSGGYWSDGPSDAIAEAMLALHTAATGEEKRDLYARVVQFGLDVYGRYSAGRRREPETFGGFGQRTGLNPSGAGHDVIRTLPMLLAGLALDDAEILDTFRAAYDNERLQTFYVAQGHVDRPRRSNVPLRPLAAYTPEMIGLAEWTQIRDENPATPGSAGSNWNAFYRDVARRALAAGALAVRLIDGGREAHGWSPLFDYADRLWDIETPSGVVAGPNRPITAFYADMWRHRFDPTQGRPAIERFHPDMWSVAPAGPGAVAITLHGMPYGDGRPVRRVEVAVDEGPWQVLTEAQARYAILGFDPARPPVANSLEGPAGAPANIPGEDPQRPPTLTYLSRPTTPGGRYALSGLPPGASVALRVRVVRADGASAPSDAKSVEVDAY